jgi:hypothetical protein
MTRIMMAKTIADPLSSSFKNFLSRMNSPDFK